MVRVGINMAEGSRLYILQHTYAYPYFLSFLIKFSNLSPISLGTYLTLFLGCITILAGFFSGFLIFKREDVSLFIALFISVLPLHIKYSGTLEAITTSLLLVLLSVGVFFLCIKKDSLKLWLLFIFLYTFSIHGRIENLIYFFPFGILLILKKFKFRKYWILFPFTIFLIVPFFPFIFNYDSIYIVSTNSPTSLENFYNNFPLFFKLLILTFPITIYFTLVNLFFKKDHLINLFLVLCIFFNASLFSFFEHGPLERFLMYSMVFIIFLICLGFSNLIRFINCEIKTNKLIFIFYAFFFLLIIFSNISFNDIVRPEKAKIDALFDFLIYVNEIVPKDRIIMTHETDFYFTNFRDRKVIGLSIQNLHNNKFRNHIYLIKEYVYYSDFYDSERNYIENELKSELIYKRGDFELHKLV